MWITFNYFMQVLNCNWRFHIISCHHLELYSYESWFTPYTMVYLYTEFNDGVFIMSDRWTDIMVKGLSWFGHLIGSWLSQLLRQHQSLCRVVCGISQVQGWPQSTAFIKTASIILSIYSWPRASISQTLRCSALVHRKVIPRALWNVVVVFISQQNTMQKFMF